MNGLPVKFAVQKKRVNRYRVDNLNSKSRSYGMLYKYIDPHEIYKYLMKRYDATRSTLIWIVANYMEKHVKIIINPC